MGKPLPEFRLALLQGIHVHQDRRVVFTHDRARSRQIVLSCTLLMR